jgi:hypothetical protein
MNIQIQRGRPSVGLDLKSEDMRKVDLRGVTLRMCVLDNARAEEISFDEGTLEDSTANGSDFTRASFRKAHLTDTSFSRALLRQAVFDESEGDGIDFRGADLSSASLKNVQFDEADFRGADLRGADLSSGRFHAADFRGALLDGTCFTDADCAGASFDAGAGPQGQTADKASEPLSAGSEAAFISEMIEALPGLIANGSPESIMSRVEDMLDRAGTAAGYSDGQKRLLKEHLHSLANPDTQTRQRLTKIFESLERNPNEPPEELQEWLKPFLNAKGDAP